MIEDFHQLNPYALSGEEKRRMLTEELKELTRLHRELTGRDWFMTFPDFQDYVKTKEQALADYEDRTAWARKMLVNIAKAGYFSSDRTIRQYNEDIWHLS